MNIKLAAIMGGDLACITDAHENEQGGESPWRDCMDWRIRKGWDGSGPDHWNGLTVRTGPILIGEWRTQQLHRT